MRIFWKKAVKISAASEAEPSNPNGLRQLGLRPAPEPRLLLQHFIECVFSAKRVLLRSEKNKYNNSMFCIYFFRTIAFIFHFKLYSFVNGGANYFFPQDSG